MVLELCYCWVGGVLISSVDCERDFDLPIRFMLIRSICCSSRDNKANSNENNVARIGDHSCDLNPDLIWPILS